MSEILREDLLRICQKAYTLYLEGLSLDEIRTYFANNAAYDAYVFYVTEDGLYASPPESTHPDHLILRSNLGKADAFRVQL